MHGLWCYHRLVGACGMRYLYPACRSTCPAALVIRVSSTDRVSNKPLTPLLTTVLLTTAQTFLGIVTPIVMLEQSRQLMASAWAVDTSLHRD